MRIYIIPCILSVITFCCYGQGKGYFFGGARGAVTTTWLFNQCVPDAGIKAQYIASFGNNYGLMGGYNFTPNVGVEMQLLVNKHVQKYHGDTMMNPKISKINYTSHTNLNTFNIPVLFKYGETVYLKAGPVLTFINGASGEYPFDSLAAEPKDEFSRFCFGAYLGFDADISFTKELSLLIGLNATYGFQDVKGVDYYGIPVKDNTTLFYGGISFSLVYKFRKGWYTI